MLDAVWLWSLLLCILVGAKNLRQAMAVWRPNGWILIRELNIDTARITQHCSLCHHATGMSILLYIQPMMIQDIWNQNQAPLVGMHPQAINI
jgi:hypothetical protein